MIIKKLEAYALSQFVACDAEFLSSIPSELRTEKLVTLAGTKVANRDITAAILRSAKVYPPILKKVQQLSVDDDVLEQLIKKYPCCFKYLGEQHRSAFRLANIAVMADRENIQYIPVRSDDYSKLRALAWGQDEEKFSAMFLGFTKASWLVLCCIFFSLKMYSLLVL